jgi:acyl-CoA thioesterase-1
VEVFDTSGPGLAAASAFEALSAAPEEALRADVVIIEIGGNDMLAYGKTAAEFEADLAKLLDLASSEGSRIVMLELPLPPTYNGFGRVQRRLAAEYGAILVPKRRFAAVFAAPGATVDGLHLSQRGQNMMAEMIWGVISGG